SIVSRLRPADADRPVFSYVTLGELRHLGNFDSMGQNAGCLGRAYDPFTVPFQRPGDGGLDLSGVTSVMSHVDGRPLGGRRARRRQLDRVAPALEATAGMTDLDGFTRRAYELLSSPASRDAFDLTREPQRVRDLYGPAPFARSCLLARRLVEG